MTLSLKPDTARLRISALGPVQVFRCDRVMTSADWTYCRPQDLFLFLVFHPPRSKEQVGLALWPDASPAQLRSNFRTAMHTLRCALGSPDWIQYQNERYSFNRALPYWCDVEEFEANIRSANRYLSQAPANSLRALDCLEQAVTLYRGDFLDDVSNAEWALLKREELRRNYLEALLTLGMLRFENGQFGEAAEHYRHAIEEDACLEQAQRGFMRSLGRLGERGLAIRHYRDFTVWLRRELATEPAAETTALYERIQRGECG